MMYNDSNLITMQPLLSFGFDSQKFEVEDDLLKEIGNTVLHDDHEFSQFSIPQITPPASRSRSPDFRFTSYDRLFEHEPLCDSANLVNDNRFELQKQYFMPLKSTLDDTQCLQQQPSDQTINDDEQQNYSVEDMYYYSGSAQLDQLSNRNNNRREIKRSRKSVQKQSKISSSDPFMVLPAKIRSEIQISQQIRERSQRIKKPSQRYMEAMSEYPWLNVVSGGKEASGHSAILTDNDQIGSRSTSERSSHLSGRRYLPQTQQEPEHSQLTVQSVTCSSRGRALKNPIHDDYVQYNKRSSSFSQASKNIVSNKRLNKKNSQQAKAESRLRSMASICEGKVQQVSIMTKKLALKKIAPDNQKQLPRKDSNVFQSPLPQKKSFSENYDRTTVMSPIEKKKASNQIFSITEVIVTSELSGKIDTSRWVNQANIVTPEFKRAQLALRLQDSDMKENLTNGCNMSFSTEQTKMCSPEDDQGSSRKAEKRKAFQKNLCNKFEAVLTSPDLKSSEEVKSACEIQETTNQPFKLTFQQTLIQEDDYDFQMETSEDEELTDDEVFLKRHASHESEEIKRYNIGIKGDKRLPQTETPKVVEKIFEVNHCSTGSSQSRHKLEETIAQTPLPRKIELDTIFESPQENWIDSSDKKLQKKKSTNKRQKREALSQQVSGEKLAESPRKRLKLNEVPEADQSQKNYNLRRCVGKALDADFVYEQIVQLKKPQPKQRVQKTNESKGQKKKVKKVEPVKLFQII